VGAQGDRRAVPTDNVDGTVAVGRGSIKERVNNNPKNTANWNRPYGHVPANVATIVPTTNAPMGTAPDGGMRKAYRAQAT
jgi:hypothetical protein